MPASPLLVERAYQLLRGDSFAIADARAGIKTGATSQQPEATENIERFHGRVPSRVPERRRDCGD